MEKMELTRIESVKSVMPGGAGCMIRYSVDFISHPDLADYVDPRTLHVALSFDIGSLISQGLSYGEFISSTVACNGDGEPVVVAVGGTYSMEPDYDLLRRIARWKCNFSSDEAVTQEDFREAYGQAFGDHFYSKWMLCERNVKAMIAYFGDEIENGQAFLGMIMKRVYQYEKRIRERR